MNIRELEVLMILLPAQFQFLPCNKNHLPRAHTFLSELLFKLSLGFLCYLFLSLVKDNKIMCLDHILVSKYQYKFLKNQLKKQLLQIPTGSFSDIYYLQYLLNYYTRQLFICVILSYQNLVKMTQKNMSTKSRHSYSCFWWEYLLSL